MNEHGQFLYRIVCTYERDRELRDDLMQDVAAAIWSALPRFRGDASVRTYIARIAHNRGVTHVAREVKRIESASGAMPERESAAQSAHDLLVENDEFERLLGAASALPLALRQVASLTLEGMPPRDISEVLGISPNAVSIKLTRAKKMLHDTLATDRTTASMRDRTQ